MVKTNAARVLNRLGIKYELREYEGTGILSGALGKPILGGNNFLYGTIRLVNGCVRVSVTVGIRIGDRDPAERFAAYDAGALGGIAGTIPR